MTHAPVAKGHTTMTPTSPEEHVATTPEAIERLRAGWAELLSYADHPQRSVHPDHYLRMLALLGDGIEPYVASWGEPGATPRAMLIGRTMRTSVRCRLAYLKFGTPSLRCVQLSYGGVLTDGTDAANEWIASHLAGLFHSGQAQLLRVGSIETDHPAAAVFQASRLGGLGATRRADRHWRRRLLDDDNAYIEHESAKKRWRIRRDRKKLAEHIEADNRALEIREFTGDDAPEELIRLGHAITSKGYQGPLGVGLQDTPLMRRVVGELSESRDLRAFLLMSGDEPVAHVFGSLFDGVYTLIATAFDPAYGGFRPGQLLLDHAYRTLGEEGVRWFDYGFGDAEYKRQAGSNSWEEVSVDLFGRSARPAVAYALQAGTGTLEGFARRVVGSGTVARLRKKARTLLAGRPGPKPKPRDEEKTG